MDITIPPQVGQKAPDFDLLDQNGNHWTLQTIIKDRPALIAFYPGDFTMICTRQLCNYEESLSEFQRLGVQILGISKNTVQSHSSFAEAYGFQFPLLSDPDLKVAKSYGCTSFLLLGGISRAVCVIGKNGTLIYRYVEPTPLTHRKPGELINILNTLKAKGTL